MSTFGIHQMFLQNLLDTIGKPEKTLFWNTDKIYFSNDKLLHKSARYSLLLIAKRLHKNCLRLDHRTIQHTGTSLYDENPGEGRGVPEKDNSNRMGFLHIYRTLMHCIRRLFANLPASNGLPSITDRSLTTSVYTQQTSESRFPHWKFYDVSFDSFIPRNFSIIPQI